MLSIAFRVSGTLDTHRILHVLSHQGWPESPSSEILYIYKIFMQITRASTSLNFFLRGIYTLLSLNSNSSVYKSSHWLVIKCWFWLSRSEWSQVKSGFSWQTTQCLKQYETKLCLLHPWCQEMSLNEGSGKHLLSWFHKYNQENKNSSEYIFGIL